MNEAYALTASNMLGQLPQVLGDDAGMSALAQAVAAILEKRNDEISTVAIYTRIDELPEELLDILAHDFKIDWWDRAYSLDTKRAILKSSWHTHRILGTKEALTTALRALYGKFEVREWWEYGGQPGYFRVETESFQLICDLTRFTDTLSAVKRLSAHLEKINLVADVKQTVGVGLAEKLGCSVSSTMEPFDLGSQVDWLIDEHGMILVDEAGQILIE